MNPRRMRAWLPKSAGGLLLLCAAGCDPGQNDPHAKALEAEQRRNVALTKRIEDLKRSYTNRAAEMDDLDTKIAGLSAEEVNRATMMEKLQVDLKSVNERFDKIVEQLRKK